jgi:hypothetical protein
MKFLNGHKLDQDQPQDNRRTGGRVICDSLVSSLGEVLDLSSTGMRVRLERKTELTAGTCIPTSLTLAETRMDLPCRVIWVRKKCFRDGEAGVQFVDLTPEQRMSLARIASMARNQPTLTGRRAS